MTRVALFTQVGEDGDVFMGHYNDEAVVDLAMRLVEVENPGEKEPHFRIVRPDGGFELGAFWPATRKDKSIIPGTFRGQIDSRSTGFVPLTLFENVDEKTGEITYALDYQSAEARQASYENYKRKQRKQQGTNGAPVAPGGLRERAMNGIHETAEV